MRNILYSIRVFSLLIAGLVIMTHMLIPHDHHSSFAGPGSGDTCPYSHKKPGHHPLFPPHCHAFNDLPADKFHPIIIKQYDQVSVTTILWIPDLVFPGSQFSQTLNINSGNSYPGIYIPDFSPFRGPPSIA